MPRVKCPRCSSVVDYTPPAKPVCGACGYGSGATQSAPPGMASHMAAPTRRPGLVSAAGIIAIVLGSIVALFALLLAVLGGAITQALADQGQALPAFFSGALAVVGIVIVIFAALYILLAVQVLKGKNWARITLIVLTALFALGSFANFSSSSIVGLAIDAFIIVALVVPASSAWFRAMGARPVA